MKCQNCGNDYEGTACPTCGMPNPAMGQSNGSYTPPTNMPPVNQGSVNQPPYAPYPDMGQSNGSYTPPMNQTPMSQPPYAPYPGMPPKKPIFKQWWFWVLIAVGVIVVISMITIAINSGKNATQNTIQTITTTSTTSSTAGTSATSSHASSAPSSKAAASTKNNFATGETATTQDGVSITMTDVTESSSGSYYQPDAGQIWVIAHFTIENNSNNTIEVNSYQEFTAYFDDTITPTNSHATVETSGLRLDGKIAPGKRMTGILCYSAPKDYKTFEMSFDPAAMIYSVNSENLPAVFTFTYSK